MFDIWIGQLMYSPSHQVKRWHEIWFHKWVIIRTSVMLRTITYLCTLCFSSWEASLQREIYNNCVWTKGSNNNTPKGYLGIYVAGNRPFFITWSELKKYWHLIVLNTPKDIFYLTRPHSIKPSTTTIPVTWSVNKGLLHACKLIYFRRGSFIWANWHIWLMNWVHVVLRIFLASQFYKLVSKWKTMSC